MDEIFAAGEQCAEERPIGEDSSGPKPSTLAEIAEPHLMAKCKFSPQQEGSTLKIKEHPEAVVAARENRSQIKPPMELSRFF